MMPPTARQLTAGSTQRRAFRGTPTAAQAAPNIGSIARGDAVSGLANSKNDNVRAPNLRCEGFVQASPHAGEARRAPEAYLLFLAWGRWGTVRFSGGRRPAWSGFTFSPSPSLPGLGRPAVACRVRSFARRSFLAARAVFRASESWVSFMGTTRSRASSSRTSTSALVSSRSMVFDNVFLLYTAQSY